MEADFKSASGGFSFVLKGQGKKEIHAFRDVLKFFNLGYSWYGVKSLTLQVDFRGLLSYKDYGGVMRLQICLEKRSKAVKAL